MRLKSFILACAATLCLASCDVVSSIVTAAGDFLHREVVAEVGKHKLYRQELEAAVPDGVSPEDSASIAMQYIKSWAADRIVLDMAESQLSKEERDVSREVEEYKISLLKYRYEQLYVNERLDTAVSPQEIAAYYEANPERFKLTAPLLKCRYMNIPQDSPNLESIRKKMSSKKVEDVLEADSLAYASALKYFDYSDTWMDAASLAREFGTDYQSMLSSVRGGFVEKADGLGNVSVAYVLEVIREGRQAPLEYCAGRIREIILNARKHALVSSLEQDLLKDAEEKEKIVIY